MCNVTKVKCYFRLAEEQAKITFSIPHYSTLKNTFFTFRIDILVKYIWWIEKII